MAKTFPDDILIPSGAADQRAPSRPFAAFVPISLAIAGVAAILLGGITAQSTVAGRSSDIDPMVTGSIAKVPSTPAGELEHGR